MPGILTAAELDRVALRLMHHARAKREIVTYAARSAPGATPVLHTGLVMLIDEYRLDRLQSDTILPTDRRARARTASITWALSHYDTVLRSDATAWRVIAMSGGPGQMFWTWQLREE
jgi:hypothetical protein